MFQRRSKLLLSMLPTCQKRRIASGSMRWCVTLSPFNIALVQRALRSGFGSIRSTPISPVPIYMMIERRGLRASISGHAYLHSINFGEWCLCLFYYCWSYCDSKLYMWLRMELSTGHEENLLIAMLAWDVVQPGLNIEVRRAAFLIVTINVNGLCIKQLCLGRKILYGRTWMIWPISAWSRSVSASVSLNLIPRPILFWSRSFSGVSQWSIPKCVSILTSRVGLLPIRFTY